MDERRIPMTMTMTSSLRCRPLRKLGLFCMTIATFIGTIVPTASNADTLRQGSTVLVSVKPDGTAADGAEPSVSEDGRYVAFSSFDRLTSGDTDSYSDVYRKDMITGQTVLVSVEVMTYRGIDNFRPSISGDGTKVAYLSGVCFFHDAALTVSCAGVYAHFRDVPASTTRVLSDPAFFANSLRLSRDGRWAAIIHDVGDEAYRADVAETSTGIRRFIAPLCESCPSSRIAISRTGRFLGLESPYRLIPSDTDSEFDVYRHDRDSDGNGVFDEAGTTAMALVGLLPDGKSPEASSPDISDDGNKVAFIEEGTGSTYVRDVTSGTTALASQSSQGVTGTGWGTGGSGVALGGPSGNLVAFGSYNPYLAPPDTNPMTDVYLRDTSLGKTTLVSVLPDGNQDIGEKRDPSISTDGRFLAFSSTRLIGGFNIDRRIYLRNLGVPCSLICLDDLAPAAPIPKPAFDLAKICWETGYVLNGMQSAAPECQTDSGTASAGPASLARRGVLIVGGENYLYGSGLGVPVDRYVAGIYLSSASRIATVAQGTASVIARVSGEMIGNFQRSMTACLNIFQQGTLLAQDCFANDAYHSEPVRTLSASAVASAGTVTAEVVLQTSKDLGYGRLLVESLQINGQ